MAFRMFTREVKDTPPPERKASATGRVVALASGAGRAVWSSRDTASLTRGGFVGNPVGFRCVKLIAEAGAAVPLVCEDRERRYDIHPVLDLLRRPNPGQGRAELFEALFGQMLLSGNGYVEAAGLGALEDQMCQMTVRGFEGRGSPDRLDALVWAIHELMIEPAAHYRRPQVRGL